MRIIVDGNPVGKVRLVTTPSTAESISRLATEWTWFWQDEHGAWNEFGSSRLIEKRVEIAWSEILTRIFHFANRNDNVADITSKRIEEAYSNDESSVTFTTPNHQYDLDLSRMVQKNLIHGTERPVCRRPKYPDADGVQAGAVSENQGGSALVPSHPYWVKTPVDGSGFHLFKVYAARKDTSGISVL